MSTIVDTHPPTRVTLLDDAGIPAVRWTLQLPTREGRELRFIPEGVLTRLGSGTFWRRAWDHRGFRVELGMKWGAGLTSLREAWTGSNWAAGVMLPTAAAHSEILDWAAQHQVSVEPFVGQPLPAFKALAFEKGPALRDTKNVIHPSLELALQCATVASNIIFIQTTADGWGLGLWGLLAWGD